MLLGVRKIRDLCVVGCEEDDPCETTLSEKTSPKVPGHTLLGPRVQVVEGAQELLEEGEEWRRMRIFRIMFI